MHTIKSFFSFKIGILTFAGVFALVSGVLALAPRNINIAKSENCPNAPAVATLNPFPVSWAGTVGSDCTDAPAIAIRPVNSSPGSYSSSVTAQGGEEFYVRIYVHNGAQQGLDYNQTTAFNVNGNVNISGGTVSTVFSGSNTNSVSGSAYVNLPSGASLELVSGSEEFFDYQGNSISGGSASLGNLSGSFNMGEMQACFEFSKFLRFRVKVVAPQVIGNGTISAGLEGTVQGQCLYNARVIWNTNNINDALVTVSDPDLDPNNYSDDKIFSYSPNSNEIVDWISPNRLYYFSLWELNPASGGEYITFRDQTLYVRLLDEASVTGGSDDFCQAPPTPSGNITATLGSAIQSQCLYNGTVTWSTQNVEDAEVTVRDPADGREVTHSRDLSGSSQTPWLVPNNNYRFTLWNIVNNQRQQLDEVWLTVPALNCGTPPPPPPPVCPVSATVFVDPSIIYIGNFAAASAPAGFIGGSFYSSNPGVANIVDGIRGTSIKGFSAGTTNISGQGWTAPNGATNCALSPAVLTVKVRPVVPPTVVTATATATASATAFASCPDGAQASASASATATASATAATYSEAYQLAYNKAFTQAQAQAYAQAQAKVVCGTPPPPPPPPQLSCTPAFQTVDINQIAFFSASGGTGDYAWTATGGNPASGTGQNFSTKYAFAGFKTVFVESGNQTESCAVKVNEPPAPTAVMELAKTVRNITDSGEFAHTISARQNDVVEYKIFVRAASQVNLRHVRVTDEVPLGLRALEGSLRVQGQPHAPGLTTGGLVFDIVNQSGVTITYRATVITNSGTLVNHARATADNAASKEDRAFINVILVTPGQPALSITKEVKNLGPSQTTGFATSINAKKNDAVQYKIVVKNVGTAAANNVVVNDSNPIGISISNLFVSKSYHGSVQDGIHLGSLGPNETATIIYNALVNIEQGTVQNIATVSAANTASEQAIAIVNVIKDATTTTGGNCNNSTNSCNNNNNQNNQTNNNSTNSSNQSNQNNINGNNNTVTNANQNCVNNSCNTTNIVYINQTGGTVPGNEFRQLSITKLVRQVNGGAFTDSVSANVNDTVEFEIIVRNIGNQVVNNAQMSDTWNGNLSLINGTVRVDGNYAGDSLNNISLGSIISGQQKRVTFQARVNASQNQSIQNTGRAWGDGASQVQDDAWVFVSGFVAGCTVNCGSVQGSSVNLVYSKRAKNDAKNADATSVIAAREDYITYTLTVTNTGNTPANSFIITDDLSQVLPYADMVDNGGGILSGNVISYPGITVPAGGSVSKSFKVRVKFHLASSLSYTMTNTYGNTITVRINQPSVLGAFTAPKTGGPSLGLASIFGSLMAGAFAVIRHRGKVWELIVD